MKLIAALLFTFSVSAFTCTDFSGTWHSLETDPETGTQYNSYQEVTQHNCYAVSIISYDDIDPAHEEIYVDENLSLVFDDAELSMYLAMRHVGTSMVMSGQIVDKMSNYQFDIKVTSEKINASQVRQTSVLSYGGQVMGEEISILNKI